jgi:hypothetical protein
MGGMSRPKGNFGGKIYDLVSDDVFVCMGVYVYKLTRKYCLAM